MFCIEIGNARVLPRIERVDQHPRRCVCGGAHRGAAGTSAFRIGPDVERTRKGVAEVRLEPVRHGMPESGLATMVGAPSNRPVGIERTERAVVIAVELTSATR